MGIFDDYITSLEGQENVDPLAVAQKLSELHNQELSTREAKIAEQATTIAEKDGAYAKLDKDLAYQKARNFDLTLEITGKQANTTQVRDENDKPDGGTVRIADLFTPKVRNRHGI